MSSSIDPETSLLVRVQRLWMSRIVNPLALVMVVLIFSTAVGTEVTKTLPPAKPNTETIAKKTAISPLPLSLQTRSRLLQRRRLTEATMTNHNLTAAYLLGYRHSSAGKLSVEFPQTTKQ